MEKAPLQTYASALVFTPIESQVRRTYWEKERLPFIKSVAGIEDSWGAHRQTLEYTGIINTMALSHDGKILASASARAIHIWHISTGTLWMTLDNPDVDRYACSSVAFSPDTKTVISNSRSATIRVWDIETGKCSLLHELGPDYRHTIGALSPDGSTALLSSSSGSEDYVCDTATGSFRACPYSCWTTALAFSPDSKMVASASRNGKIYLWDSATCVVHQTLEGGSFMVESLAFSPKTKMLAAAGYSGEVRLWDTETGVLQRELRPRDFVSRFFALSPDGTMFASRSLSNSSDISLWDTTGVLRQTLKGHTGYVTKIVFSLDSKMLVSASRDGIIHTWDVTSALDDHTAYLGNSTTSAREMPLVHSAEVTTVALSPDGKTAATASADHTICLWDIIKGSPPQALQANLTMRDPGATFFYMANGITFSPDGKTLAVCGEDTIFFWDVARGTLEQEVGISRPLLGFRYLTFSPDGKTIATEVWSSAIYLSSTETGTLGRTLEHDERQIARALGFSQDGATFASCAGDVFLWDVATGELQRALEHTSVAMRARFSPDGRTLVSLSNDDMVRIWNLSTGSMSRKILQATGGWVPCAETFSTDGMCVFVETDGGLSRVKLSGRRSKNFQEPKPFPRMFVTGRWVRAGGVDLLWLPPSYKRGINAAGHGVVVLGRQDGTVTILRFDTSTLEPRVLDA